MNINIYGSTGIIGKKTLSLIDKNFPSLKVDLLCAKSNLKLLTQQIKKYKPILACILHQNEIVAFAVHIQNKNFDFSIIVKL